MRVSYSSHVKCLISHRAFMEKKIISYDVPSLESFNVNKFQVFPNTFICDEEIYPIIISVLSFFQILKLQTQKNLLKTFRIRKVPLNLIHRPTPNPAVLVPRRNLRQNLRRYHLMSKRKTRNQNSEKPEVILQDRVKEVHRSENDRPDVVDYFQKNTLVPQM